MADKWVPAHLVGYAPIVEELLAPFDLYVNNIFVMAITDHACKRLPSRY